MWPNLGACSLRHRSAAARVLVALWCVFGLAACGRRMPNPPTGSTKIPSYNPKPVAPRWHWVPLPSNDLPLTHDASRLGSATGQGSFGGYDRYREVALAGRRGEPAAELVKAEAAAILGRGWRLGSTITVGVRGTATSVPIGTPGAIASFNGPRHHEWVNLSVYTTMAAIDNQDIGPPLDPGRSIRDALRTHRPVLDVMSAQRSYKPVPQNELS